MASFTQEEFLRDVPPQNMRILQINGRSLQESVEGFVRIETTESDWDVEELRYAILKIVLNTTRQLADAQGFLQKLHVRNESGIHKLLESVSPQTMKLEPKTFLLEMRKVDFQQVISNQKTVSLINNIGQYDAIENVSIKAKPVLGPIIHKYLDCPHGFGGSSF